MIVAVEGDLLVTTRVPPSPDTWAVAVPAAATESRAVKKSLMGSIYLLLCACGGAQEPRAPSLTDTSLVLVCEDPESFRATLAGPDTTAFLGCASYAINPGGWVLNLFDGPHTMPDHTLQFRRGAPPTVGLHAVGDQTGLTSPRFTATLASESGEVFQSVEGTVRIVSSHEGNVQGQLSLTVQRSGGASYSLSGTFAATCAQRPTLGC